MKINNQQPNKQTFFQNGITLNEYLLKMSTNFEQNDVANKVQENLYETCGNNKLTESNFMTFQIRQSDEDEYEEQNEQNCNNRDSIHPKKVTSDEHKKFLKNTVFNLPELGKKRCTLNIRQLSIKQQSKSPFTDRKSVKSVSEHKNFALTFFVEDKTSSNSKRAISPILTLTGKFPKNKHDQVKAHQVNAKTHLLSKYSQQINLIKKYEKQVKQKEKLRIQASKIRIDCLSDKLYNRKLPVSKTMK